MHLLTLLFILTSVLSPTTARIIGFSVPRSIASNTTVRFSLHTERYIQRVTDVSVAVGFYPPPSYPKTVGYFITTSYLGPQNSNVLKDIPVEVYVPDKTTLGLARLGGPTVVTAEVHSLYGVLGMPTSALFNVTVDIGDRTSEEHVMSDGWVWLD